MVLERCIKGIVNKCPEVNIQLVLYGIWRDGMKHLEVASLPNVQRLELFACASNQHVENVERPAMHNLYAIVFSGSTFPDLRNVYLNTTYGTPEEVPASLEASLQHRHDGSPGYFGPSQNDWAEADIAFNGLLRMEKITLAYNHTLTIPILQGLFNTSIIPKRLTSLEIVNCRHLHPINSMQAIATLLERGLQLLQSLKIHLSKVHGSRRRDLGPNYNGEIDEHPEYHVCNIIRQFGGNIKSLDLGLPFACNLALIPRPKKAPRMLHAPSTLPSISLQPYNTLSQRMVADGYRHRRMVLYEGICRGAHSFDDFVSLASEQGENISWEFLSEMDERAVWCVSGCLPVEFDWESAMAQPLVGEETLDE